MSNNIYNPKNAIKFESVSTIDIFVNLGAGILGSFVGVIVMMGIMNVTNTFKQINDIETASVKEGNILKADIITKNYDNTQKHKLKNVVIDTNNNGIEDADDVVINGKLFTFSEAKEGRNVVFLQSKRKTKPLAVENENGKFDVKKAPSDIYYLLNSKKVEKLKELDEKFDNIIAQKTR